MEKFIENIFDSQKKLIESVKQTCIKELVKVSEAILKSYKHGGKLITFGNGGSAADAQHMVCELTGRFMKERPPINAVCLNTNISSLTSIANDYGYDKVFSRQLEAVANKVDCVFGISTSGNSSNVIKAIESAKKIGCTTITLTGGTGGTLKQLSDYNINIDYSVTPRIQEIHIMVCHILCEIIEQKK